jgi:tetratricopeptide (TPR) repeat protein
MIEGIELIDWKNYSDVIKFYEKNKLYIDNYQIHSDAATIVELIKVKQKYCDALISKYHYSSCIELFTHLDILINKLDKDNNDDYNSIHEEFLFTQGYVFGQLKKYDESQIHFKELIKIDPENDLYKDWYENNRNNIIKKNAVILIYIGIGYIVIDIIASIFFNTHLSRYLFGIAVILMVIGFSLPDIVKQIRKIKL